MDYQHLNEEEEDGPACRFCHEHVGTTDRDELIQPCLCTGSIGLVHRSCLDQWRTVSPNPDSFDQCDTCEFSYLMRTDTIRSGDCGRKTWLVTRITLDIVGIILLLLLLMAGMGFVLEFFDATQLLDEAGINVGFIKGDGVHKGIRVTLEGVIGFFFFLGCAVILAWLWKMICGSCDCCDDDDDINHSNYGYYRTNPPFFIWWYYPFWWGGYGGGYHHHAGACLGGCSGCHGHRINGGGNAMAIIAIVVIAIIVIVGFIAGAFLLFATIVYIVQRHSSVMWRHSECKRVHVVDLRTLSVEERTQVINGGPRPDPNMAQVSIVEQARRERTPLVVTGPKKPDGVEMV